MNDADFFLQQSRSIRDWYHREQEAAARPCHLYALIDGILDTTVLPQIEQTAVTWCSLYPDSMTEAASPAAGPYLVDLGRHDDDSDLVMRLALDRGRSMDFALWIVSQHPLPVLAEHLQQYAEVELPDKTLALLRYYDPSILPALLRTFTSEQRQWFLAAVRRCAWQRETWESIDGGDSDVLQPLPGGRIALDDKQYRQLGGESFAESLYYRIGEDLLPPASQLDAAKCIEYIRDLVTKAGHNYQMTTQADLMLFALTGLNVSLKFDEHPDVVEVLHAGSAARESLADRLACVDDKVWRELRNTRPTLS